VLSIVSLASQQPIPAATLTTASGQPFQGDASGRVTLTSAVEKSSVVTVSASGFLDRRTVLTNHTILTLWPRTDVETNLTEDFTRDVVYRADCGTRAPQRMMRLSPAVTHVYLAPTPDIMEQTERPQPWAMPAREAHERAVAELNRVLAPGIRFELVSRPPPAAFVVPVTVGPTAHTCSAASAFASFTVTPRGDIIGGEITHCGLTTPQNGDFGTANLPFVVLHEMGHILGLAHSRDVGDVMFSCAAGGTPTGRFRSSDFDTLSARERLALPMMLQRSAGNAFPDDDSTVPGGPSIAFGPGRTVIVH
jgi:hypothetical protein